MRVLVLPHELTIGGSQRNAIDLARAVRDRGADVAVAGPHGVLAEEIRAAGIRYEPLNIGRLRPSPPRIRRVRSLIRRLRPDVIHAYEWPAVLEAYLALAGRTNIGLVGTVLSMDVDPEVPRTVPLLLGTPGLRDRFQPRWQAPVDLCEPPVDAEFDEPHHGRAAHFRAQLGIAPDACVIAVVSRIARRMKLEGIVTAIRAMERLGPHARIHLVIAGDGDAMADVRSEVERLPAPIALRVHLVGELRDPRPAYAAADVVLGMGGSALRALAHERALVVVGEQGFVRVADRHALGTFIREGFYGVGTRTDDAVADLAMVVARLARDVGRRRELGRLGRQIVLERYALPVVTAQVLGAYARAADEGFVWSAREAARAVRAAARRELAFHLPTRALPEAAACATTIRTQGAWT